MQIVRVGIRLGLSRNSCLIDAEILRMPFPLLFLPLPFSLAVSLSEGGTEEEGRGHAEGKARKKIRGEIGRRKKLRAMSEKEGKRNGGKERHREECGVRERGQIIKQTIGARE